jgi:peptide/nickel transport system permease protein
MGKLLIDSINRSDRPVMVAYLMIVSFIFVLLNFIVDVLYSSIDPRIDLR